MTDRKGLLDLAADAIKAYKIHDDDKEEQAMWLDRIVWIMAVIIKKYCYQQGKNCDHCKFRADVPEERQCGCKINIGKNECGTAPRFWEVK